MAAWHYVVKNGLGWRWPNLAAYQKKSCRLRPDLASTVPGPFAAGGTLLAAARSGLTAT